jgi:hypothetical protein
MELLTDVKLKGKSLTLVYHESPKFLEMSFTGPSSSDEYRKAWDMALEVAVKHGVKHWFFDQKKMSIHPDDLKWATENWYPRSVKALGQERFVAIIASENFFSEFQVKKNLKETAEKDGGNIAYFRSREEAIKWLKTKY